MANSVDPDQTAPIGAVCFGSTLFVSILDSSVMLGNYLQQMTSADNIFRCIFFLVLLGLSLNIWTHWRGGCGEGSGSVVECLTRDRGVAGSSLTGITALCP